MTIRVIRAAESDAETVGPLFDAYRVFYKKASDPAGAERFIRQRLAGGESVVLVALAHEPRTRTDSAAGFTQLYPAFTSVGLGRLWILNDLFVAPEFRRQGVAEALMRAAEGHAKETGAVSLALLTAHDNAPAQALYARMGWSRDEQFQRWTRRL